MKAKKLLLSSIIATQVLTATVLAAPDEAIKEFNKVAPIKQEVKHFQGEVKLFIIKDGEKVRVDQKMTDGLRVVNGRTCVGVRDLVNAIEGAKVEWDGTNHIVDITYDGKTISYPVGKPLMWADGKAVTIDVPAQIDPAISKTFLPIRNIAETLGFKVYWDNKAKEVVLTPGAGKGVTTAQQPRPTTQTPTQNKNLAWVTASGQRIPKPEELPMHKIGQNGVIDFNSGYTVKLKPEDLTQNPNGSTTFFKGTVLEYNTGIPFKKVDTIAKRPSNFNIFKSNKNDPRVGTAIITKGHSFYDSSYNEVINDIKIGNPGSGSFLYITKFIKYFTGSNVTEIPKEEFKRQCKDFNREKSDYWGTDLIDFAYNNKPKVYDATGLIDVSPTGLIKHPGEAPLILWSSSPSYYITTAGAVLRATSDVNEYIKKNGNFIIDKVIFKDFSYYVVDIPDLDYMNYINKNKHYDANYLVVGDFRNSKLAK
ncbi:copper amine oxidase N-terminal domain-containing protein [Fenollaria timonensis]|uniref:copper amine oxidase N-terminal domain-containing protein n=1 Tax=Fenollaria timonensis TaxID=1723384 RepID=UPI0026EB5E56|nr:copper amine oxidase N-terminal domain-containing protein [Fenollaria timonensis]